MSSAAENTNDVVNISLDQQQSQSLEQAVAGFTSEQLIWSSGYLAGLARHPNVAQSAVTTTVAGSTSSEQLTILYGSQTGNGRELAVKLHQQASSAGMPTRLVDMADYSPRDIAKETWVALVVSTHGEGDAPDDAELLLEYLQSKRAPKLDKLNFSVLALGDSSYAKFCQTGKDFDEQLAKLGAKRYTERVDCDLDYHKPAQAWSTITLEESKILLDDDVQTSPPVALQVVANAPQFGKQNPYLCEVLQNQKITGNLSTKNVHHLELDLQGSGLQYEPGDALGVVTPNPQALVDEFLQVLHASEDTEVMVDEETVSLGDALTTRLEITSNSGAFLQRYAQLIQNDEFQELIDDAQSKQELLNDYQIIDVLNQWPLDSSAGQLSNQLIEDFVGSLRALTPRVYSISSSPLATPDEVHITVAQVAYEKFDRPHWGSASTALTQFVQDGESLPIFIESNPRFRLPENTDTDVIMIGPGTGVAPFRSFVEHRVATGAKGRNWLFFGDRNFDEDFLYQIEWQRHLDKGNLHRLDLAFSRDQAEKIYVQDRLLERGEEIYQWLQNGARLYVCGDSAKMAPDVNSALIDILVQHGNQSVDDATQYLKTLKREQRYLRDVY